jgi:hypothetical protein
VRYYEQVGKCSKRLLKKSNFEFFPLSSIETLNLLVSGLHEVNASIPHTRGIHLDEALRLVANPAEPKAAYPFRSSPGETSSGEQKGSGSHPATTAGGATRINHANVEMTEPEPGPSRKRGREPADGKPKGTVTPVHDDDVSKYSYRALPADIKRFLVPVKLPTILSMWQ